MGRYGIFLDFAYSDVQVIPIHEALKHGIRSRKSRLEAHIPPNLHGSPVPSTTPAGLCRKLNIAGSQQGLQLRSPGARYGVPNDD
jgi:hypothetical protein